MIKEACANYFHLIRHPFEAERKRSDKILTVVAYLSCITLIVPPLVGLVYGVSSLAGRIKKKPQHSEIDLKVRGISSAGNSSLGKIDSDSVQLDDNGNKLLDLCQKVRQTEGLNQKAKAIAEWRKAFLAEIAVTSPGSRMRLVKDFPELSENDVITFSEQVGKAKNQGKEFKLWMNDSTKGFIENLKDYNEYVDRNIAQDNKDDYVWGFGSF